MFLAVAIGRPNGGHASLEDLIGAADWINHAIPMDDELIGGLNRLIAAGVVDEHDDSFALTQTGEAIFAKVQKRAGIRKQFERLRSEFENLETPQAPGWVPATGVIDAAVAEYQKKFAAMLESIPASAPHHRSGDIRER